MSRHSAWSWSIPLLLTLQLGLLWIQGAQLHRQNQLLRALRSDVQDLADSLDNGPDQADPQDGRDTLPLHRPDSAQPRLQRVALRTFQADPDAASKEAEKELEASRESAKKAVKEAREDQSKLSFTDNARKAEEARKLQGATNAWQRWSLAALGVLCLAWIVRAWLRRR